METEIPTTKPRSKSLSAIFLSVQDANKLLAASPAASPGSSSSSHEELMQAFDFAESGVSYTNFGRRSSMPCGTTTEVTPDGQVRRLSDSRVWKWLTSPGSIPEVTQSSSCGNVQSLGKDSATPGIPGQLNLARRLSSRDLNAVSPSQW